MNPKRTGYWRQEKDAEGRTTRIYELMSDGSEVETGYKHAYDDYDDIGTGSLIMSILIFIAFIPVCIIGTLIEWWRWRK